jgi:uncharacterized membrane protein YagU involved in acid resistance
MKNTNRNVVKGILIGGLIAGAVDIAAASLISDRNPALIAQTIAGGLLANATFNGGVQTVVLGTVLQEAMAILIAAIYVFLSGLLSGLQRRWITSGIAYGVIIFFVMNYVVVPLSAWKAKPHFTFARFAENLAAMLLFGLIVTFFSRRATRAGDRNSHRQE